MQKSVEDILRKVAIRHNVSFDLAKAIWINEWKYAAFRFRCGKRGNFEKFRFVYLPGLMRFYTARGKVAKLQMIGEHIEKCKQEGIKRWKEKKALQALQEKENGQTTT